ncbi:MAG: phosphoglucosamine mutase, partial [Actinobacteria bacterium]|nr:phosphoglucosamine mutase [Actinomycetota bacterium]
SASPLSKLAHFFEPFPQVLINVGVRSRDDLAGADSLWEEVRRAEAALGKDGRVLVRASGTEPVVRVMVEDIDEIVATKTAGDLADSVKRHLG